MNKLSQFFKSKISEVNLKKWMSKSLPTVVPLVWVDLQTLAQEVDELRLASHQLFQNR